jgi:TrmH family RNA methyltransferase
MAHRLTSLQNQRVKDAVRLRDRRGRDDQRRIVIDGIREMSRALQAGVRIVEVFAVESVLLESELDFLRRAEQAGAAIFDVSSAIMEKLAYGERDAHVIAVAETPSRLLDQLSLPNDALIAVLERVEKPGNLGAVVRSADAARVAAVIVADGVTDLFNPNAIRASAGAIFSLPVVSQTSDKILARLRAERFRILATRVDGSTCYWDASFSGRTAIVFGNEATGLSDTWSGSDVQAISLPRHGISDSLNISVTAAVLFYEALPQREKEDRST